MKRFLQIIFCVHRIHHYTYSYGYKLPFINYGFFPGHKKFCKTEFKKKVSAFQKLELDLKGKKKYHNCTLTGIY